MKNLRLSLLLSILLLSFPDLYSQDIQDVPAGIQVVSQEDIFRQGVWNFNLDQILSLSAGPVKSDGEKTGTNSIFKGQVEANYFIIDNLAVGVGVGLSSDHTNLNELTLEEIEKITVTRGNVNVMYGRNINSVINIITKASVGFGTEKGTYEGGSGYGYEYKEKFTTIRLTAGVPIKINRNIYFNPYIGYEYHKGKEDDFKTSENNFLAGFSLEYFMGCGDKVCDIGDNFSIPDDRYHQNQWVLNSQFNGSFSTGGRKNTHENQMGEFESKSGIGSSSLSGKFLYYAIDDLGVGAGITYGCDRTKIKDSENKTRDMNMLFYPVVRYNAPVDNALQNLFIEGAFGVGVNNRKFTGVEEETTVKNSVTDWSLALGWNYFLAEHFAFTPYVGYGSQTQKDKDSDIKSSTSGIRLGIGWSYFIN